MHGGQEGSLGVCPICGDAIGDERVLIEYELDGDRQLYAECPDCLNIVHPEEKGGHG